LASGGLSFSLLPPFVELECLAELHLRGDDEVETDDIVSSLPRLVLIPFDCGGIDGVLCECFVGYPLKELYDFTLPTLTLASGVDAHDIKNGRVNRMITMIMIAKKTCSISTFIFQLADDFCYFPADGEKLVALIECGDALLFFEDGGL